MHQRTRLFVWALENRIAPAIFTVTNTNNSGAGSLRQAIIAANGSTGADTVAFEPTYFNIPRTITLTSGQMVITDVVTIQGSGPDLVTVSANKNGGVFQINPPTWGQSVVVSGLTLTQGTNPCLDLYSRPKVTISNCRFSANSYTVVSATSGFAELTIIDSTISGNTGIEGTINAYRPTSLLIENSTITGNTAQSGGAIWIYGFLTANAAVLRNSTLSGNSVTGDGGAIWLGNSSGSLAIQNCTIVNNSASGNFGGGGIARVSGNASITLDSSIVANNKHTTGDYSDLFSGGSIKANVSAVGSSKYVSGFTPDATTTALLGMDFKLATLASNGGPTQTHELLPGSPCIDAGSNVGSLTNDQRGTGFNRIAGLAADIGAFEVQPSKLSSIQVNDGSAQRSMVTSLVVTFDKHVTFAAGAPAAFSLVNATNANQPVTLAALVDDAGLGTVVTLTFTGGSVNLGGSLSDGRYTLAILAAGFSGAGFDGNANGVAQGSPTDDFTLVGAPGMGTNLFRLFGDSDGDGTVAAADFIQFRLAFGGTSVVYDFDADGSVSASDFIQFRLRFGGSI